MDSSILEMDHSDLIVMDILLQTTINVCRVSLLMNKDVSSTKLAIFVLFSG